MFLKIMCWSADSETSASSANDGLGMCIALHSICQRHHLDPAAGGRCIGIGLGAVDGQHEAWEAPGALDVVVRAVLLAVDALQLCMEVCGRAQTPAGLLWAVRLGSSILLPPCS